jgi:hypothetical protein
MHDAPNGNGRNAILDAEKPALTVDPVAEAQKVIEADRQRRAEACKQEIDAVLTKYRCTISCTQPQQTPQGLLIPTEFVPLIRAV